MTLTAEQLLTSIWAALRRIEDNLALPPAPLELPAPHVVVSAPDLTDLTQTLMGLQPGPTALELARAIADVLPPSVADATAPSIEMYDAIVRALERLDFRMQAPPSQGYIGGSVNLQAGQTVGISNFPATPLYTVVSGEVSVAAGATFVTIVADTPAAALTLVGYNAEMVSLLEARVRMRLITGTDVAPTILHTETVTTGANSWQPLRLSALSGTRVAVQAIHGEITAQVTRGSLNWSNP